MKNGVKRLLAAVLMIALAFGIVGIKPAINAEAASKVKRQDFVIMVVKAMKGLKDSSGKEISYTLNKDGSVTFSGKTIKADTVNKLKKTYDTSLEKAQYLAIAVDMGLFKTSSGIYKSKKAMAKKINNKDALTLLVNADNYLYGTKLSSEQVKLAKSRISNLKKAGSKTYQENMAKAYALGFYVGTKDGDYKTTRTFKFTSTFTKKSANTLIGRLTNKDKRYPLSDDYQVIRTTKLPKTADLYPYILDAYPNEYYDTAWIGYGAYEGGTDPSDLNNIYWYKYTHMSLKEKFKDSSSYYMPAEYIKYAEAGDNECVIPSKNRKLESTYKVLDEAIEFYKHALNVDYRTIKDDKDWFTYMNKYLSETYLNNYITNCIKNKTIVECDVVAGDKSTLYLTDTGRFKIYLHFRVVSDKVIETNGSWNVDELVPVMSSLPNHTRAGLMYYMNYKVGEWIDYYVSPGVGYGYKLSLCDLNDDLMVNYYGFYPWLIDAE